MRLQNALEAGRLLDRAKAAMDAGLLEDAAQFARESVRLDPQNVETRILQARVDLALNRPKGALAALDCYDLYAMGQPQRNDVNMLRAEALLRVQQDDLALPILTELTEQLPDDVRVHRMIVAVYTRQNQLDQAVDHLKHILRLQPDDQSARHTLAQLLEDTDPQGAVDMLCDSTDPATRLYVARQFHGLGRLRDAEETYRELLADQNDDPQLWLEAAQVAMDAGANALALERFDMAVKTGAKDERPILHGKALLAMRAGRFARAGRCWMRLTQLDANMPEAWAGLMVCAMLEERERLVTRAASHLKLHMSANERRTLLARVWHYASMGLVIRESRKTPVARDQQSFETAPLEGLLKRASQTLAEHARQIPLRADTHYHRAQCQQSLGNQREAVEHLQIALAINPTYLSARRLANELNAASAA